MQRHPTRRKRSILLNAVAGKMVYWPAPASNQASRDQDDTLVRVIEHCPNQVGAWSSPRELSLMTNRQNMALCRENNDNGKRSGESPRDFSRAMDTATRRGQGQAMAMVEVEGRDAGQDQGLVLVLDQGQDQGLDGDRVAGRAQGQE